MKFCDLCNNLLYISVSEEKDLNYYCKNCNNTITIKKEEGSVCVIDDNKIDDFTKYSQYINKNLKYDPTLPRVNNIVCVNSECTKKTEEDNSVIYIKYDHINMKYIYHCCYCEHFWRNI
jgi:DNA-directed RNA polymerase subunit M/transcription elongation factor TFIIS